MSPSRVLRWLSTVAVLTGAIAPCPAAADSRADAVREGGLLRRDVPGAVGRHEPRHPGKKPHHPAPVYPPYVYVGPTYGVPYLTSPPVHESTIVIAAPPPYASSPGIGPALPSVVEHPGGRYERRGDGVGVPYTWVWVPDPPAAPPSPPASPAPARDERPVPPMDVYRWVDAEGVVHLTNDLDSVPAAYRNRVKRIGPL